MYLLETIITVDVNNLSHGQIAIGITGFVLIVAIIFISGLSIKTEKNSLNMGGIVRLLEKKDDDTLIKESLKKFSDSVDHEIEADLYDLIENIDDQIDNVLVEKHCYFTMEKFSNLVKRELQKRVRRNNLREKLTEINREKYIDRVLKDVEERYALFQAKAIAASCGERYGDFITIRDLVRKEIGIFFDSAVLTLIEGMRKKRNQYKTEAPKFKTKSVRVFSCDIPDNKNRRYIESLTGKEEPAGTWYKE